jgi:hypothetical protein
MIDDDTPYSAMRDKQVNLLTKGVKELAESGECSPLVKSALRMLIRDADRVEEEYAATMPRHEIKVLRKKLELEA